ncbi:MAG: hypothetical protein RL563_2664 [Pseudomonadota bacterium]
MGDNKSDFDNGFDEGYSEGLSFGTIMGFLSAVCAIALIYLIYGKGLCA